jgi:signal transduction histidine kinase
VNQAPEPAALGELEAALFQAAVALGLVLLCILLAVRYRKPAFRWWALAWTLYLARSGAILSFLTTADWDWLYWHQVLTGWTGLALLWAALVFSRQLSWRASYALAALFPPIWSYVAIYRLDNFLLAALPAVLFLSVVTLLTGAVFLSHFRKTRSGGAAVLAGALLLWGLHHLDYPFLRARGAWTPWGYYLDTLFLLATGAGLLLLVLDDLGRGLSALSALSGDVSRGESEQQDLDRLLGRTLELPAARGAALYTGASGAPAFARGVGACARWDGLELAGEPLAAVSEAIASGRPRFTASWPDLRFPSGRPFAYAAVLPVLRDSAAAAALVIVGDARDPFAALDERFLLSLGRQIGTALDHADLYRRLAARKAELERLSQRMIAQHEEERRRLSMELHDETAQVFSAVKLQLGLLKEKAEPAQAAGLDRALALVDQGIVSIRGVTHDLRPSLLDDLGLVPALRSLGAEFGERCGVVVRLDAPARLPALSKDAELALFRSLQEALSNVARHAGARSVEVGLEAEDEGVVLRVRDDGRGFGGAVDLERLYREGHAGLTWMRERVLALGGTLEAGAGPGGGAEVVVRLPATGVAAR